MSKDKLKFLLREFMNIEIDTTKTITSDKIVLNCKDSPEYLISPERVLLVKLLRNVSIEDD